MNALIEKYGEADLLRMVRKKFGIAVAEIDQPGPIGIRFTPSKFEGAVEVLTVQPNSQAAQFPRVRPGMVLSAISREPVRGRQYRSVIETLKKSSRPLELQFKAGDGGKSTHVPPVEERRRAIIATFTEPGT